MAVIVSLYILMNSQAGNFAVDALRRAKLRDRGDIVCVRSYIALTICIDVPQTSSNFRGCRLAASTTRRRGTTKSCIALSIRIDFLQVKFPEVDEQNVMLGGDVAMVTPKGVHTFVYMDRRPASEVTLLVSFRVFCSSEQVSRSNFSRSIHSCKQVIVCPTKIDKFEV